MPDHGFTGPDSGDMLAQQTESAADPYLRLARWCGMGAVLIGISVILGWMFGTPALNAILPGLKPIAVSAAIAFILLGSVQLLLACAPLPRGVCMFLLGIALLVTVFGLLEIVYLVTGVDVSLEDAIFLHDIEGRIIEVNDSMLAVCGTMAPGSICAMPISSLRHSSACTPRKNFPAPASGWSSCNASSPGTGDASGRKARKDKGRQFILR